MIGQLVHTSLQLQWKLQRKSWSKIDFPPNQLQKNRIIDVPHAGLYLNGKFNGSHMLRTKYQYSIEKPQNKYSTP
jgi:hypothetical protein